MTQLRAVGLVLSSLLLSACFSPQVNIDTPFDPAASAYVTRNGSGTITGQAFMRQMGGGVVTCAGSEVTLVPATGYFVEAITETFGASEGGRIGVLQRPQVNGTDPRASSARRATVCDAQGNFTFRQISSGEYYVLADVTWYAPTNQIIPEGGSLAKRIRIQGGETVQVILN